MDYDLFRISDGIIDLDEDNIVSGSYFDIFSNQDEIVEAEAYFDLMKIADDMGYYGRPYRKAPYTGPARYFGPTKLVMVDGNAVIVGNTMKIKSQIGSLGFAWNGNIQISGKGLAGNPEVINGAMVKTGPVPPEALPQLQSMGVDVSTPNLTLELFTPPVDAQQPAAAEGQETVDPNVPRPTIEDKEVLDKLRKAKNNKDTSEAIEQNINDLIEMMSDPARRKEAEERILRYANFSSKMWNYSLLNRIMIMLQRPDAEYVGGAKSFWAEVGRTIKPGEYPISILSPIFNFYGKPDPVKVQEIRQRLKGSSSRVISREIEKITPKALIGFKTVPVYDIKQTQIDPNWRDPKTGEPAMEMEKFHEWTVPPNNENEYAESLSKAAEVAIKSAGIPVKYRELSKGLGGYYHPETHSITISTSEKGLSKFRTIVHEWAHAYLIAGQNKRIDAKSEEYALDEVDADGASFVIMKAFGIDEGSSAVANYLLGWTKGDPQKIRIRQQQIDKAVKHIVGAIRENIEVTESPAAPESELVRNSVQAPQTIATSSVYFNLLSE